MVNNKELFEYIFKRKSIRKYRMETLPEETSSTIENQVKHLTALAGDLKTEIKLLPHDAVKGLLAIKAPHYLLFFSEKKEGHLENAGYMLQQMDLYLSSMGLGTCWLGMAKPTSGFENVSSLPFVIAMAVGTPAEPVHRTTVEQYKRKLKVEICSTTHHSDIIEAARLAPSATNSQPWRFRTTPEAIHVYRINVTLLKAWLYERMNKIDMGIALCHLQLAAEAEKFQVTFRHDEEAVEDRPLGTQYTMSLQLVNKNDAFLQ